MDFNITLISVKLNTLTPSSDPKKNFNITLISVKPFRLGKSKTEAYVFQYNPYFGETCSKIVFV